MIGTSIAITNVRNYGSLLLDKYPNAVAAYSLRKLRSAYTGYAVKVRRSSDNAEQDIGFVGSSLDETSLLSFVGAGDGFVTTWYDQSGSGDNATQGTAANQPKIVSSGAIINENGKPTIDFNGSTSYLTVTNALYSADINLIAVLKILTTTSVQTGYYQRIIHLANGTYSYQITRSSNTESYKLLTKNTEYNTSTNSLDWGSHNGQVLISARSNNANNTDNVNVNSASQTEGGNNTPLGAGNNTPSVLGARNDLLSTTFFEGNIQELILHSTPQDASLRSLVNIYYGVY